MLWYRNSMSVLAKSDAEAVWNGSRRIPRPAGGSAGHRDDSFRRVSKLAQPKIAVLDDLFRALADPTRLRLLNLIAEGELCVCYFVQVLGVPQPKISRHLAYLRKAGIVAARREGKWMHYRMKWPADQHAGDILRTTIASFKQDRDLQCDLKRLSKACCGSQSLVNILGAPAPMLSGT
jgi:ArsR family transcriptional regulator